MANQARGMPSQVIALWVRERHGPKMLFGKLLSKSQGLWGKGLKSGKTFKSSQHELPYIGLVSIDFDSACLGRCLKSSICKELPYIHPK